VKRTIPALFRAAVDDAGDRTWLPTDNEVGDLFDTEPDGQRPSEVDPEDVAVMIPTSGTTGRLKLVMQTHLAYVMVGKGFPYWMQLTADDRLMTSLPLFHINAPVYSALDSIAARASLVLLPGFSASTFLDSARRYRATLERHPAVAEAANDGGGSDDALRRSARQAVDARRAAGLVDIGIPPTSVRGVVLVARTAGLVAHLTEEVEAPIGMSLGHDVERRASP
jgi:acyl-CoA synthetase (AMP-forming)/AMP-acid ligase II